VTANELERETMRQPEIVPEPELGVLGDIEAVEKPWYKSLIQNVRELFNPPKLAPLEVTSKPVEVAPIWGAYKGAEGRSAGVSVLIHIGVVGLLLLVFQTPSVQKVIKDTTTVIYVPPYKPKLPPSAQKAQGGGGRTEPKPAPPIRGEAPRPAPKTFVPPTLAIQQPKLPTVPTINAPAPQITADNYGDPLANAMSGTFGSGKGSGIGPGNGNGYGPGSGGGTGGGVYKIGGDVSSPQILTKVEPEYSEEARKAKYQGAVVLQIVVDANGIPRDIKVVRPLGLGLDEKAIEAVQHWRFRPALKGGKPVAVTANIEVNFRLL
jgi:periplasmic protein TonB